jgi:predicted phosphodiesterase
MFSIYAQEAQMKLNRQVRRFTCLVFILFCGGLHSVHAQEPCTTPCQFRFALYGDTRSGDAVHRNIVAKVVSYQPAMILQTGDLVFKGDVKAQWDNYDAITAAIRNQHIPFYPAQGNHDIGKKGYYEAHVPPPVRPGSTKLFYAFEQGDIRFISINTMQSLQKTSTQYRWLEAELRDAQAAGKFIVPYFHIAIFSVGHHGSDLALRGILHPLFRQYGVKLVFQGHDHNYYRTQRDGITYIVSGGGGAGLYTNEHKAQGRKGDKFEMANNYTIGDVLPAEMLLTTYASVAPLSKPYKQLDQLRCALNAASPCQVVASQ